jgi:DNA-binding response OmpR family regulator
MATEARVTLKSVVGTRQQIFADNERLTQVLTNLVSNAIKFSPQDSEVTVTVEARGDNMLRFAVSDLGPGIPAEQMSKLFGMFQQLDSSDSRRKGGTGLGLAISKSIVEQHRGRIGVDSRVGEGSVFWFDVPAERSGQSDNDGSGVKILVVESDDYWTEVLHHVFSDSSFDAVYVDSTANVKWQLTENRPDLIVLDLQSTNGQGVEFLESLKLDPKTVDIPVVILSTDDQTVDHKGLAFIIDWIKKPFEPRQIKKAVTNAFRKNHSGPVTVLIVEDDPATREVLRQQIGELGVTCLEAVDGLQAIDVARAQNLDLIILDLGLPLLDGFEVVKVLREDKSKHIPLIVYSNRDLSKDDKRNLSLGLTNHLVKSRTTDDELIVCVKGLLNGLLEVKT